MSEQDFRERMLNSIEDLKRTTEDLKRTTDSIDIRLRGVETDVAWIKGKLEGRQEAVTNRDAKSALWIALGSAAAAILSLIKSFW